jgi:GNAT superfamily N-acetyltransferase
LHANSWRSAYRGIMPNEFLDDRVDSDRQTLWTERFSEPASTMLLLKAVEGHTLQGFACTLLRVDDVWGALLDNLHVRADLKRQRIGTRLFVETTARLRALCVRRLHLWVFEANSPARRFYEGAGGIPIDSRTDEVVPGVRVKEVRYAWDL